MAETSAFPVTPLPRLRSAVLYLFTQEGCPACAAMKIEIAKFKTANPDVWVHQLDETHTTHAVQGVTPRALPALVFVVDGKIIDRLTTIGAVKARQIEKLWSAATEDRK